MSDICIEFDDVVAGYKDFMILNNLSLKAKSGAITLLLGPNGAGKSTVLKTLFGLLKPRQGRVLLDFNRAYNPPCAFTPFATCPLPPPENRLDLRVEAGERDYRKPKPAAHPEDRP